MLALALVTALPAAVVLMALALSFLATLYPSWRAAPSPRRIAATLQHP
jgi:ABC-type lipoprotein release transport system permease subunit